MSCKDKNRYHILIPAMKDGIKLVYAKMVLDFLWLLFLVTCLIGFDGEEAKKKKKNTVKGLWIVAEKW